MKLNNNDLVCVYFVFILENANALRKYGYLF